MQELLVPIEFEWVDAPGAEVQLVGDFPDWKMPLAMAERDPGRYRLELLLPPGLYRYKLRVNRRWHNDPRAQADDYAEGVHNSLLIVGGAAPPLYFAPSRKQVLRHEDGRLLLHVEHASATPAPAEVWVRYRDGDTGAWSTALAPLTPVARRADRVALAAQVDLPCASVGYFGFKGISSPAWQLPAPRQRAEAPPAWADGLLLYAIFVDRWWRGSASAPLATTVARNTPSHRALFYGGDLDGITEALPYLADLGVEAILLTPLHLSPTPHRYDPIDLTVVDPQLGGEAALARLLTAAHLRGLKVFLDLAVTHVNEKHPAFADVLAQQERSPYAGWFRIKRFPVIARDVGTYEHYYTHPELPWLNLRPGPAREHVISVAERLVRLGADGVRLDAMLDAPLDFWAELRRRLRRITPDLLLLGEVVSDNVHLFAEQRGLDLYTDFQHREAMLAFFGRGPEFYADAPDGPPPIDAAEFWERTCFERFRHGPENPHAACLFLDNHDTARFLSVSHSLPRLRLALAYLLLRPEAACLTYATEAERCSGRARQLFEENWAERLPMPPLATVDCPTHSVVKRLAAVRRALRADGAAQLSCVRTSGRLLVLERRGRTQGWRLLFNADTTTHAVATDVPPGAALVLAVNDEPASAAAPLPPCAARVVRLAGTP